MLKSKKILVIGGSSGLGLEVARLASAANAQVVIAGRSKARVDAAKKELGNVVDGYCCDIGKRQDVKNLFGNVGAIDHLVITAADLVYGPIATLSEQDLMRAAYSKLLGPIFAAQECSTALRSKGSITFTGGIAARRPIKGGSMAAALNSALEGLCRALAVEMAPTRVNVISPGWMDTPIWDSMPNMTDDVKRERFAEMSKRLLVGRIGKAEEVASAVLFLMTNEFVTGTALYVDGGHRLV